MKRKRTYEVGRGKPPLKSRFKPGVSGNPRGRPRPSKTLASVIEKEFGTLIPITQDGRIRKLRLDQIMVRQMAKKAANGDSRALSVLLNALKVARAVDKPDEKPSTAFDTEDHGETMKSIIRKIKTTPWDQLQPKEPPAKKIKQRAR